MTHLPRRRHISFVCMRGEFRYRSTLNADVGHEMSDTTRGETKVSRRAAAMHDPSADARYRVLRLLEADPTLSQKELAEELGVSVGQINYVLKALIQKGHVKLNNFRSSTNKPRYLYLLTPAGIAAKASMTASFLQRKMAEYERLKAEIEAVMEEAKAGEPPEPLE